MMHKKMHQIEPRWVRMDSSPNFWGLAVGSLGRFCSHKQKSGIEELEIKAPIKIHGAQVNQSHLRATF